MRTKKPKPQIEKNVEDVSDLEVAKKLRFDLSFESVKKLLSHQTCFYTNRKFEEDGQFSRSFDRVDSAKGYVEGNVVACTIDINGKKSNLSMEEIECIYNKLVKVLPKKKPISDIQVEIVEISEEEPKSEEVQTDI
jgi:hypothetical protein